MDREAWWRIKNVLYHPLSAYSQLEMGAAGSSEMVIIL
jgi:hypothetical protein